jgi:hypothetical protein
VRLELSSAFRINNTKRVLKTTKVGREFISTFIAKRILAILGGRGGDLLTKTPSSVRNTVNIKHRKIKRNTTENCVHQLTSYQQHFEAY